MKKLTSFNLRFEKEVVKYIYLYDILTNAKKIKNKKMTK
jgi:hypothetical protein